MTLQTGGYGFIFSNSVMRLILEGRLQGYRVRLLKGTTLSAFEAKLLKKKRKKKLVLKKYRQELISQ